MDKNDKQEGVSSAAATLGRKGGSATSPAKAAANQAKAVYGHLGGRPRNLRAVNAAEHVHQLREPWPFSNKADLVRWLCARYPDHAWSRSWSLSRLDSEMRDVELMLEWD